jgi:hypothetical protein
MASLGLWYGLPSWISLVILLWAATALYDTTMLFIGCRQIDEFQVQYLIMQNDQLDVFHIICADVDNTALGIR